MLPLYVAKEPTRPFNNLPLVIGVVSVLPLLPFHRAAQVAKAPDHVRRVMMMITFGVSFGSVVMGRISLLLGVLETVYGKWLGLLW